MNFYNLFASEAYIKYKNLPDKEIQKRTVELLKEKQTASPSRAKEILDTIMELNYRYLLCYVDKKYSSYNNECKLDIFQNVSIGFLNAINNYDLSKNCSYITYSYPFMKGQAYESLCFEFGTTPYYYRKAYKISNAMKDNNFDHDALNSQIVIRKLSKITGISEDTITALIPIIRNENNICFIEEVCNESNNPNEPLIVDRNDDINSNLDFKDLIKVYLSEEELAIIDLKFSLNLIPDLEEVYSSVRSISDAMNIYYKTSIYTPVKITGIVKKIKNQLKSEKVFIEAAKKLKYIGDENNV